MLYEDNTIDLVINRTSTLVCKPFNDEKGIQVCEVRDHSGNYIPYFIFGVSFLNDIILAYEKDGKIEKNSVWFPGYSVLPECEPEDFLRLLENDPLALEQSFAISCAPKTGLLYAVANPKQDRVYIGFWTGNWSYVFGYIPVAMDTKFVLI